MKPDSVRKELSLEHNTKINYKQIPMIIDFYNKKFNKSYGYHVVNETNQSLSCVPPVNVNGS